MKLYSFRATQRLPVSINEAWEFFSDASKLPEITPSWMNFEVSGELPNQMYAGMIATYRLKPMLGIPINWVTEITHVEENRLFVDEQRFGPYRFWHHQHHFIPVHNGIEMKDVVHYSVPLGVLGQLANFLSVEKRLKEILQFRKDHLNEIFAGS